MENLSHKGPSQKDHSKMKPVHSASDKFAAKRTGHTRRSGKMLHETEHHERMGHELDEHEAYPNHE
jgi:hypothetical protein